MSAHVEEQLLALIERRLAPSERSRVVAHLDQCPRCRAAAADLAETAENLAGLRAMPVRAAHQWPAVWARVRAVGPARKLGPQASVYLGLVTSLLAFVSVVPGMRQEPPASVTAGVAAGPQLTQPATVVFHAADVLPAAGTAAERTHGPAAPTVDGTAAVVPVPIPTPVPLP